MFKVTQVGSYTFRLFDVASDPDEAHDLATQNLERAEVLRRRLIAHLESVSARTPLSRETAPIAKEVQERLKSLGYLQ